MFVPIPSSPSVTVVNKTVVYSDTVLPLNDFGKNLNITTIHNVKEYEVELCLKKLFETNLDTTFNTIQYSKKDRKLYIYADKEVSTKAWDEINEWIFAPLVNSQRTKEEINSLLQSEPNLDSECISLSDVIAVYKDYSQKYHSKETKYSAMLKDIVKEKISDNSSIVLYGFDSKNKYVSVGFKRFWKYDDNYETICFKKKNDVLYLVKSESCWDSKVFQHCNQLLSGIYDFYLENDEYHNKCYDLKAVNTSLDVRICGSLVRIGNFRMGMSKGYRDRDWNIDCNNGEVMALMNNNSDKIAKSIFVRIEDCPKIFQPTLKEFREKQLKSLVDKEGEKKKKTILEKIFPFTKRRK